MHFKIVQKLIFIFWWLSGKITGLWSTESQGFWWLNQIFKGKWAAGSAEESIFTVLSHHFQMMILSDWRIILRNGQRIFFLIHKISIASLIFPIGVTYWENQIHLRALIFGSHIFLFWHMFVKCRSGENENGYQGNERGFFSEQTDAQNHLSIYIHLSWFKRYKTITTTPVFNSLAHFLWQKVPEIDGNSCYLLGGNSTS